MDNGSNGWAVRYSSIGFFERMLKGHGNVVHFLRVPAIYYLRSLARSPPIAFMCLSSTPIRSGLLPFTRRARNSRRRTCVVLAGDWNAYTLEAKELANAEGIGLLTLKELVAAIWREEPHKYFSKDRHGNPVYHTRAA